MTIRIRHILCPIDFSDVSRRALDHAIALARWYDARLSVLHVHQLSMPVYRVPYVGPEALQPIVLTDLERRIARAGSARTAQRPARAGTAGRPV